MKEKSFNSEKTRKKRSLSRKHILVVKQDPLYGKKKFNVAKADSSVRQISRNLTNENKKNETTLYKKTGYYYCKSET